MRSLYQSLLYLQIAAGSLSLLTGGLNMILPKGGKRHRKIGRLFVTGMMLTGGSALLMAQIKPNPFLFIIGVFTIYLVGTADRYIKLKQNKPLLIDWVYTLGMFVFGSIFIIWGIITLTKSDGMGSAILVFGSIGLYSVYRDFSNYNGEATHRNYRLFTHIGRMVDGFTATVTAVLVVNAQYIPLTIPTVVYWLAPTLLFTPLSVYWIKQRKK
ncbi:MAG: DUF2306 domain-containing protein [Flavobacteriaceae bacterium]|nr:DUF2306 domain-containing protein [Flavobacteriaceae bacterium]